MRKFVILFAVVLIASCSVYYINQDSNDVGAVKLNGKAVSKAPDFSAIADVSEKKQTFFSYLKPGVAFENERVLNERNVLKRIKEHFEQNNLSGKDVKDAKRLASNYKMELTDDQVTAEWVDNMLLRVDVLPEALVLTQAANESAWGTSRFATKAKNYFGQWCYVKGCGLVPNARSEGMTHEVAKFKSVQESIHQYFMNVNSNNAYAALRDIRSDLGRDKLSVDAAIELTNGLLKYSERGEDYVSDLQDMIQHNQKYWVN